MDGIILLNGDPYSGKIETEGKFVICCDGALEWATRAGVSVDLCVGDFDSLGYMPCNAKVFPVEKNLTDGEIALDEAKERGIKRVEIYGGSGRREDHFFGNVGLLLKARSLDVDATFFSDYTEFRLAEGRVEINEKAGTTVSLFSISEFLHINRSEGLKYSADGLTLRRGESRCLSNILTKDKAAIEISSGLGIIFIVRKL
ncbi:MAG: thiamine diphosphokinase [Clostridia bacterium]|nr:thiamine diphosphokinase [Clostridia bacterium]